MAYTAEELQQALDLLQQTESQDTQRLRTFAQGATLGWADEAEARVRSALGGGNYEQIRDEVRTKIKNYKQDNPSATGYEIAGAIIPAIAAAMTYPVTGMAGVAGVGALEGGVMGAGYSEAETGQQLAGDIATGTGIGAVMGPATMVGLNAAGSIGSKIINFAREKFGKKSSDAVQAELNRLVEQTGKSVDEIVADIESGRLMTDNKTLLIALKNMVNQGGESGRAVMEKTTARYGETRNQAEQMLRENLAPGSQQNILATAKASEEALKDLEGKLYKGVFESAPEVSQSVSEILLNAVQRNPEVMAELNSIYANRNLVPLFKQGDNGAIELSRIPSLEDAEIARRILDDKVNKLYKAGSGTEAGVVKDTAVTVRNALDNEFPQLAAVRAKSSQNFETRRAFELGRKALNANVDELQLTMEKLSGNPEAIQAIKLGLMDAIKSRLLRTKGPGTLESLANEDQQFGAILRTVLDGNDLAGLERQLSLAAETGRIAEKMPLTAGSPTQALQQEAARAGSRVSASDVGRVASGDMTAMFDIVRRLVGRSSPNLSDAERMQVVDVIFSRDADLVRKALTDQQAFEQLMSRVATYGKVLGEGAGIGAQEQATQLYTGEK